MELIDKKKVIEEIEKLNPPIYPTLAETLAYEDAIEDCKDILDSIKTKDVNFENERKEDKEMPTSGECVTLSKERYQELLEYESVALWAFNVIIVESLPSIEDEKLKEISDDAKLKAVQAAFQEALKNKEDKE